LTIVLPTIIIAGLVSLAYLTCIFCCRSQVQRIANKYNSEESTILRVIKRQLNITKNKKDRKVNESDLEEFRSSINGTKRKSTRVLKLSHRNTNRSVQKGEIVSLSTEIIA
jgi:hypothetical protein